MGNAIFENSRAKNYDQFVQDWIPNYCVFLELLPRLLSDRHYEEILVVGCGTGNEIEVLLTGNNNWKITGLDPSPEMVDQARKKLKEYSSVNLIDGELDQMYAQQRYGAVTLILVLHFLEDNGSKLQLLKDISSHLKPGAPIIILDITGNLAQIKENLWVLSKLIPSSLKQSDVTERIQRIENNIHFVSEDRIVELLKEAGFENPNRFFQTSIYMGWFARKSLQ